MEFPIQQINRLLGIQAKSSNGGFNIQQKWKNYPQPLSFKFSILFYFCVCVTNNQDKFTYQAKIIKCDEQCTSLTIYSSLCFKFNFENKYRCVLNRCHCAYWYVYDLIVDTTDVDRVYVADECANIYSCINETTDRM